MAASNATLRRLLAPLALAALPTLAAATAANAQWFPPPSAASPYEYVQWFPPIGAASPQEIAQRLRAEGFVLVGPLRRNDTVYLVDVNGGPAGRERLVIDAWSGEILQRFVARSPYPRPGVGGGYVIERGEFDSPPPLAPPPARDFFVGPGGNGSVAYGGPANARIPETVGPVGPFERPPRTRVRKPAASRHAPAEFETDNGGGRARPTAEAGRRRRQSGGERQFGRSRNAGRGRSGSDASCVRSVTTAERSAQAGGSADRIDAGRAARPDQGSRPQSRGSGGSAKHGPDLGEGRTPPGSIRAAGRRSGSVRGQAERQVEGQRRAGQPARITKEKGRPFGAP